MAPACPDRMASAVEQRLAAERERLQTEFRARLAPGVSCGSSGSSSTGSYAKCGRAAGCRATWHSSRSAANGRGELYPYSTRSPRPAPARGRSCARAAPRAARGVLWDTASRCGHSVRTVDECIAMPEQDITVQTTLLDATPDGEPRLSTASSGAHGCPRSAHLMEAKQLEQRSGTARYQKPTWSPTSRKAPAGCATCR